MFLFVLLVKVFTSSWNCSILMTGQQRKSQVVLCCWLQTESLIRRVCSLPQNTGHTFPTWRNTWPVVFFVQACVDFEVCKKEHISVDAVVMGTVVLGSFFAPKMFPPASIHFVTIFHLHTCLLSFCLLFPVLFPLLAAYALPGESAGLLGRTPESLPGGRKWNR